MLSMKVVPKFIVAAYLCCFIFAAYVHFSGNLEILAAGTDDSSIAGRNLTFCSQIFYLTIPGLFYLIAKKLLLPALIRFTKNPIQEIKTAFSFNRFQTLILIFVTIFIGWSVSNSLSNLEELKADGAPPDFIQYQHQVLGSFIASMLVPAALAFYAVGFIGKKYK